MPYRRRRSGIRRRPRPEYTWVRNSANSGGTDLSSSDYWSFDLLAPLHYDEVIMRVPGAGTALPMYQSRGATVVRIRGQLVVEIVHTQVDLPFDMRTGVYAGILVGNYQSDVGQVTESVRTSEPYPPNDPANCANTSDWMAWTRQGVYDPKGQLFDPSATATARAVLTFDFDVRSRRRLKELQDTVAGSVLLSPGGSPNPDVVVWGAQVTTSTLLARRR